ncbi:MAG TPA: hypothetical protein VJ951_16295 [Bacteroidales bacterium]|nr:hypothetical protein [Bacteroidales bacterium]
MMPSSSFTSVTVIPDTVIYTPVEWSYDTLNDTQRRKTAMFVPVYINDIGQEALMQFDLGANLSGFYYKTINLLGDSIPELNDKIKRTEKGTPYFENAKISLNKGVTLHKDKLYMWKHMGHDSLPESLPVIGTLGYDILDNYILIIDYVNDRIALVESIPDELEKKITYIPKSDLEKFPVILPFKLGEKKIRLFFDTGSSSAQVLTSTKRLKRVSLNREIEPLDSGYSWGNLNIEYKATIQKIKNPGLYIDDIYLQQVQVTGMDRFNTIFSLTGRYLYGFTGNVVFENCVVVIDRKNNKFGLVKETLKSSP